MPRIRLCDDDLAKYAGPEWVEIDLAKLSDMDTGLLEEFEQTVDLSLTEWTTALQRRMTKAVRAEIWLARRLAGCSDKWTGFWPKVYEANFEPLTGEEPAGADDADPPVPANREARRRTARTHGRSTASAG